MRVRRLRELELWQAANELSMVVMHPVTAAARDHPIKVPRYSGVENVEITLCFDDLAAALAAWDKLPDRLRDTTLRLLVDMTWQRAMECAELLHESR